MLRFVECSFPVPHPKNTSGNTKTYPLSFIFVMSCLGALSKALHLVTTLKCWSHLPNPRLHGSSSLPFYNCGFMLPPHVHKLWQKRPHTSGSRFPSAQCVRVRVWVSVHVGVGVISEFLIAAWDTITDTGQLLRETSLVVLESKNNELK